MPHHQYTTISGKITHIFGHRFVIKTELGDVLADITPKGAEKIALHPQDDVTCEGEMKPSELKVVRLSRGEETIHIEHKKKHPHHDAHADPSVAVASARADGFAVLGAPRRKPKHFEVLGRKNGELNELQIELDGHIRKRKAIEQDDRKWLPELRGETV